MTAKTKGRNGSPYPHATHVPHHADVADWLEVQAGKAMVSKGAVARFVLEKAMREGWQMQSPTFTPKAKRGTKS